MLYSENLGICLKKNKLKIILEIECECYCEWWEGFNKDVMDGYFWCCILYCLEKLVELNNFVF